MTFSPAFPPPAPVPTSVPLPVSPPAVPAAPPHSRPELPSSIHDAIVLHIETDQSPETSTPARTGAATIELAHPSLGSIELELTLAQGTNLDVRANVASAAGAAALRASETTLRRDLQAQGVQLRAVRVQVRSGGAQPQTTARRGKRRRPLDVEA